MKKLLKIFFYCTGFAALSLVMQVVAIIPVTIFLTILYALSPIFSGNPEIVLAVDVNKIASDSLMPAYLLSAVLTFFTAWIIHIFFKREFIERLSFKKAPFIFILVSFVTGCSLQMPISFIMALIENAGIAPDLFEQYSNHIETLMTNQSLVLQILAVGIVAPLIEEIIFRGMIFNQLKNNIPVALALVIQALLFGIVHLNIVQGIYAFLIGIVLGLSIIWSKSLILPVFIHMGMNLAGIVLSEFGAGINSLASLFMLIISFLLIPICMLFLYHKTREEKANNTSSPEVVNIT